MKVDGMVDDQKCVTDYPARNLKPEVKRHPEVSRKAPTNWRTWEAGQLDFGIHRAQLTNLTMLGEVR